MGRTIGIILIAVGVIGCVILTALMGSYVLEDSLPRSAAVLGFGLGAAVLILPLAAGVFMLWKGGQEAAANVQAQKQRELLNMVKTQGQVAISDLAIEMDTSRDRVQAMLYDLVGKGLFSGYVNWDEGMLYSRQASELRDRSTCEVCGGQLELAGHGVIRCPYCGTEYFLE
ncbi:MAG TPA: hypothetical protein VE553_09600 [Candidatus Binatia bacterium]|jgi:hypothetical protein|nr:hypothetical protein [Candidatus Binatia bacterium]